ncbi:aldose 1-epimerase [uncultured Agrobacterium sp.]|uniref:aldose epimerase family protein n=1 Tax=uncultured Agrobacterium sp. TaxID=157277 RepID=UPI0025E73D1A|nr:aldose 1-epimerase [uncultured Agrobacterium sp.]
MPLPDMVEIASGPISARFAPRWGGRLTHLIHAELGDILVPTHETDFDPWNWPKAGAYPLFPYHNRVAGAAFCHLGKGYTILPHPALAGDAMHGPAHRRVWRIEEKATDRATLRLDYEADTEWPFSFTAWQTFILNDQGLALRLKLLNRADRTAPAVIGWHPYIQARLDDEAHTDAKAAYPLDPLSMPIGSVPDHRDGETIPASSGYTLHFRNWSKAELVRGKAKIVISADQIFAHIAVHRTERYLCLEPVSAAAGVLGLPESERQASGLVMLAPGENLSGDIKMSITSIKHGEPS